MNIASLFAGIAGLELGLHNSGHVTTLFCEIDEGAQEVLRTRFPSVPLVPDVRDIQVLPGDIELVTAGFPCQDLSQAGKTKGISGQNSGLVDFLFKILETNNVPHLLIENVPFMLQLNRGHAINHLVTQLEKLGYAWAYRVIDANCFGIPQRRERVFLFASKLLTPRDFLFFGNESKPNEKYKRGIACGFYWTEGTRGLGWAVNSVPTIKGGSTIGIPSPPAIWLPDGRIVKPDIRDAERLQGFDPDWTIDAERVCRRTHRWKLVGNAVCVGASEWMGMLLADPEKFSTDTYKHSAFNQSKAWPTAAFGGPGVERHFVNISKWPVKREAIPLIDFLKYPPEKLSLKATTGFYNRLMLSCLRYPDDFKSALERHIEIQKNIRN